MSDDAQKFGVYIWAITCFALVVALGLFLYMPTSCKELESGCEAVPTPQMNCSVTIKNNIQASHTITKMPYVLPSKNDGMGCFSFDDWGELFGSSMQPTFFEGNTVLEKKLTPEMEIKTGDIVRFYRLGETYPDCDSIQKAQGTSGSLGGSWVNNSMAVIHRVNAIYDDYIVTQGDNLLEQEDIQRCQVTHIVVGILFT